MSDMLPDARTEVPLPPFKGLLLHTTPSFPAVVDVEHVVAAAWF